MGTYRAHKKYLNDHFIWIKISDTLKTKYNIFIETKTLFNP
jgi:hypothetical protein